MTLTRASTITPKRVRWLWDGRIALGSLALLAGREGIGKSIAAYTLAADLTRGRLVGEFRGKPRDVIVAATEDDWACTIVPRLMAAGADLDRVHRIDVTTADGVDSTLLLPKDLTALRHAVRHVDAALILLDPLMSRLDAHLDTHRDADVRKALEPLVQVASETGAALLGLIHVNKGHSSDPLTSVMGSRAFAAVARAVLYVMLDPDDENVRLLGQPKNNLGRTDLPSLTFTVESAHVADTDEGPVWTGRLVWGQETDRSIADAMETSAQGTEVRTAVAEAADWLSDWLAANGGTDDSANIKAAGAKAGHSPDAIKRARRRIKAEVVQHGFPRKTYWNLPGTQPAPVGAAP